MTHAEAYRRLAERAERVAQKMESKGMNPRAPRALAFAMLVASRTYGGGDFPDQEMKPMPDVDPNPGRPPFEEPRFPQPGGPLIPQAPPQPPPQPPKLKPPVPTPPVVKMPPSNRPRRRP